MEVLKKGTIEPILVGLRDRLENLTDLSGVTNLKFDVKKKSDGSAVSSNLTCTFEEMTAICLIDTTLAGYVAGGGTYKLYLKFDDGVEHPVLGPIFFRVEDD